MRSKRSNVPRSFTPSDSSSRRARSTPSSEYIGAASGGASPPPKHESENSTGPLLETAVVTFLHVSSRIAPAQTEVDACTTALEKTAHVEASPARSNLPIVAVERPPGERIARFITEVYAPTAATTILQLTQARRCLATDRSPHQPHPRTTQTQARHQVKSPLAAQAQSNERTHCDRERDKDCGALVPPSIVLGKRNLWKGVLNPIQQPHTFMCLAVKNLRIEQAHAASVLDRRSNCTNTRSAKSGPVCCQEAMTRAM